MVKHQSGTVVIKLRMCICGCGESVTPGRQFRPGHDGRLRSIVLRAFNGDGRVPRNAIPYLLQSSAEWMTPDILNWLRQGANAKRTA